MSLIFRVFEVLQSKHESRERDPGRAVLYRGSCRGQRACACHCFNGCVYECTHTDLFDKVCKSDCPNLCARGVRIWVERAELCASTSPRLRLCSRRAVRPTAAALNCAAQNKSYRPAAEQWSSWISAHVPLCCCRSLVITPSQGPRRPLCTRTNTKKSLARGDGWRCRAQKNIWFASKYCNMKEEPSGLKARGHGDQGRRNLHHHPRHIGVS